MKFSKIKKEDALKYTYRDLAFEALKEKGSMPTAKLFRMIIDKVGGTDADYENKIATFYTNISTDKRFVLLEDGKFDLREKHGSDKIKKIDDEDDLEDLIDELEEEEENLDEDEDEDDRFSRLDKKDYDEDEDYDDLADLVVVDEDDLED